VIITPQKRVLIGILTTGIITATITTLAVTNVLNLAAAQIQVPFTRQPTQQLPQQFLPPATSPRLQQQQPVAPATTATASSSGGPNCNGCVTTQNLANGAVTTPKIAPGAVSITVQSVGQSKQVGPGETTSEDAICPAGTVLTGGGFSLSSNVVVSLSSAGTFNNWHVAVTNTSGSPGSFEVVAQCATMHP
jgi:hypothetical protein